jgi:hypothetical protein
MTTRIGKVDVYARHTEIDSVCARNVTRAGTVRCEIRNRTVTRRGDAAKGTR